LATGPVYVSSNQAAAVQPIQYNPAKAKELLTKAGWSDSDKNGVLDKVIDGKKTELKVSMIYARKESEKMWTMVKEDYKKAGIDLELKFLEWNSFLKTIDDNKMQLYAMSWGGGSVEMDPKQIWHSSSSGKGGSNRGAYANPEVDKLIDQGRAELNEAKRTAIFKKAYTIIANDVLIFSYLTQNMIFMRFQKELKLQAIHLNTRLVTRLGGRLRNNRLKA
jgi:ABC-type transport system substrate-binding protein